jgi:hypothetical protein
MRRSEALFREAGRARTDDDRIMSSEAITGSRQDYTSLLGHFQSF